MPKPRRPKPIKGNHANSHIEASTFDPETGHLTVTFPGGRKYRYEGVDADTAGKFRESPSQGAFLHSHVIGKFDTTKI